MLERLTKAATAVIGLLLLTATSAVTPGGPQWVGEISSSALLPLSPEPAFDVIIYDDTEQNLEFREAFLNALSKAGYGVGDNAPYEFSFATSIMWQERRQREVESERLRTYPVERSQVRPPIRPDTALDQGPDDRIFGDRRTSPPLVVPKIGNKDSDRLDISVTLRERSSNEVVWIADLALPLHDSDRKRIVRSIIGPIIRNIGRDVNHQPFEIR